MKQCNISQETAVIHEMPLAGYEWLTFRHLVLVVSSCFGLIAIILSLILTTLHATHYSKPWEQKHIMRILTMVPVYTLLAWFSFMYYHLFVYLDVALLIYWTIIVVSFYLLMCHWIAPDYTSRQETFRHREAPKWLLIPLCGAPRASNGLVWYNVISAAVLQYAVVNPILGLVAFITQATKQYCTESLSPDFAHLWIEIFSVISVIVALWGLANFYYGLRKDLAAQRITSKFIALKLVLFVTFSQDLIINMIAASGVVPSTPMIAIQDFRVGLPAMLICVEMAFFALFHLYSYPWQPYRIDQEAGSTYQAGRFGIKAIIDAWNIWDVARELARSWRWVFTGHGDGVVDEKGY